MRYQDNDQADTFLIRELKPAAHPLPADPEEMNEDRSKWAARALSEFMVATGTEPGDVVSDLLCDLAHFCDRHQLSLAHELNRAESHYSDETLNQDTEVSEGQQFDGILFQYSTQ